MIMLECMDMAIFAVIEQGFCANDLFNAGH
jgi:hypothetical protein